MPKKIVICCDGTGNQISNQLSNVLKFYRVIQKSDDQLIYYSPGVGTVGDYDSWQLAKQKVREVLGLATGYGLDANVLDAYRFLCTHYEDNDEIWLFGFSRGAYTVRVLAAFVYVIGLLKPGQLNLADYAFTAYKKASHDSRKAKKIADEDALRAAASDAEIAAGLPAAWEFRRVAASRAVTIKFIGVWDTVASVIVPRPDRLLLDLQSLRFTRTNPGVEIFRHASPSMNAGGCSGSIHGMSHRRSRPIHSTTRTGNHRTRGRYGLRVFTPISAAAIPKQRAGSQSFRCCG